MFNLTYLAMILIPFDPVAVSRILILRIRVQ